MATLSAGGFVRILIRSLMLTAVAIPAAAAPVSKKPGPILFWHNQVGVQQQILATFVREFNAAHGARIRMETGVDIESALLTQLDTKKAPHLLLSPADVVGYHKHYRLSEVPANIRFPGVRPQYASAAQVDGKTYAVPILGGNHLLLFYNKKFVKKPAQTWDELAAQREELNKKGVGVIGWYYVEPYYFLPFLTAFGSWPLSRGTVNLDTVAMRKALEFYKSLSDRRLVPVDCGVDCPTRRFYGEKFAYAINGDWALHEASRELGSNFGVTAIPQIGKSELRSVRIPHALAFPGRSLSGPHRDTLIRFTQFLLSPEIQTRWMNEAQRIPALERDLPGNPDEILKLSLQEEKRALDLPSGCRTVFLWQTMRKGMATFFSGGNDAADVSSMMQKQAKAFMGAEKCSGHSAPN